MSYDKIKNLAVTGIRGESPLGIRLSSDFRELLKQRAKGNGRSVNSEILVRLRDSMLQECVNEIIEMKKPQCWNTEALNALTKLQG